MSKHITGQKILETYEIQELELFELVSKGKLQPYNKFGNILPDPILEIANAGIEKVTAEIGAMEANPRYGYGFDKSNPFLPVNLDEPKIKKRHEALDNYKLFLKGYHYEKNRPKGTVTWQWLKMQKDWDMGVLKQYDAVKNAIYFSSEVEQLLGRQKPKEKNRSKRAMPIYKAAAARAVFVLQDLIQNNILATTREDKLAQLKDDKRFQERLAPLRREVKPETLIRRLNEAHPGIWKMGRKPGKEAKIERQKKYRKKRNYDS